MGAARDAGARRRLLQRARRGLGGRRGQVLRLDGGRARATSSGPTPTSAIRWFGATEDGNFAEGPPGANVLEDRGPRPDDATRRAHPRPPARAPRAAGAPRARRQAADLLERPHDLARWPTRAPSLGRADLLDAAETAAAFVWERLRDADGRLLRTFNAGEARLAAYLEDHAFLLEAMLTLYEATAQPRWFAAARERSPTRCSSASSTPSTAASSPPPMITRSCVARRKDLEDAPIPAGGSAAAFGLLRLAALTGEHRYEAAAEGQLRLLHGSRRVTRARSRTCCRRSTSVCPTRPRDRRGR